MADEQAHTIPMFGDDQPELAATSAASVIPADPALKKLSVNEVPLKSPVPQVIKDANGVI